MNEYGIYIALDYVGLGYLTVKRFIVFTQPTLRYSMCVLLCVVLLSAKVSFIPLI